MGAGLNARTDVGFLRGSCFCMVVLFDLYEFRATAFASILPLLWRQLGLTAGPQISLWRRLGIRRFGVVLSCIY